MRNRTAISSTATELLHYLKDLIKPDPHTRGAADAVVAITNTWKDYPDTLLWLKTCAQSHENFFVRQTAVQELARGWRDDPDTLLILKSHAQSDEDWDVRRAAVQELTNGWKGEPSIFELLQDRAANDPFVREYDWQGNPRQTALEAIIEQYPDYPQTLPLLRGRARNDSDYEVREFAVQELAKGWKDEPWLFELLYTISVNDPFERKEDKERNPRQTALEIIIKQYPDHPQSLPLLQDRAENDSDEKVRQFAQKQLSELEA